MALIILFGAVAFYAAESSFDSGVAKAVDSVKGWIATKPEINNPSSTKKQYPAIKLKESVLLDVPAISQLPELERGCEVTSLTMLLRHAGVDVDKTELAKEIKKNGEKRHVIDGVIHYGHPNEGFVGNMHTRKEYGLGVYHKPVAELAEKYMPNRIKDLTGVHFEELKIPLSAGKPVWVIINTRYQQLSPNEFETWKTPQGEIKITYKEHSVLLTGYNQSYIYFNDPLTGEKNKKAPISNFTEAWVQMGKQAITYLP